ncbi:MAG: hypothetical protein EU548_08305, partial [Promethearchaeota archaeon]
MFTLTGILVFLSSLSSNISQEDKPFKTFNNNPKNSDYIVDPIYIDGTATGMGAHNWTWASSQPWCSGNGTWRAPYLIKDLRIDGKGLESCITIKNSNVPLIIQNCTLFNADAAAYMAGIHLDTVNNSLILKNNCSENQNLGIIFYQSCYNNTIKGNTIHNNNGAGISSRESSLNNTIRDNWIANLTGARGAYILESDYIKFINNTVEGCSNGIRIHATEHARVINNTFKSNQIGISMRYGHYAEINQNKIKSSWNHGIFSDNTAFCEIHHNHIYNTTYDGIRLIEYSRFNEIYSNKIIKSSRYGAHMDDTTVHDNLFYMNYFADNDLNANNDGIDNYWDNGSIGNYWDDYRGYDENGDRIGETPYDVPGNTVSQDNFPICYILSPIYINGVATGVGAHNWTWASSQPWCSGKGTKEDPYIIANEKINGLGLSPLYIENSDVFFIIEGCTLYNSTISLNYGGIYLKNCQNGKIKENRIFNTFAGIHLRSSSNNLVSWNNCSSNGRYGIRVESSNNNNFSRNDCSSNDWVGIHIKTSNNNNIFSGNNCSGNGLYGIESDSSSNNSLIENDCTLNNRHGIYIYSSSNGNTISMNNCSLNNRHGIYIYSSSNGNRISMNNCSSNNQNGIYLHSSNNDNKITGNICDFNEKNGIDLNITNDQNIISNNDCDFNKECGICLFSSSNYNKLSENNCS